MACEREYPGESAPCQVRSMQLNQVTLPAANVADSVAFFQKMGFELIVDSPHYARFKCPVGDSTFSVHAVDDVPIRASSTVYFECANVDEQVATLKSRGFQFTHDVQDQRWLWREARLEDPSGNVICLYHAGENRLNPPWRVRRAQG